MMPIDFVHVSMFELGGEIQGKTALQKKIYFLGVLTGMLDELGYRPHFYGPYSDEVAQAIAELKTIGYVEQDVRSAGVADAAGFERRRYDYRLTDAGKRVAQAKAEAHRPLSERIHDVAERLKKAGSIDYMRLSIAAKTYFLFMQQGAQPTESDLAQFASKFGWHVKPQEVQEAASYLAELELLPRPA